MSFDAHANFAYSTVLTAPSPASSGTSLVVQSGDGAKFPAVPFNAVVFPAALQPLTTNAEIVRVTAVSTDTFTITRTQENTTARSILVGDQIANVSSAKVFTDIETNLIPLNGWIEIGATLTYSSTDGHTFVVTSSIDLTGSIGLGDRITFSNNGVSFYGIVTAITTTNITLYGGTQYTVINSAITLPFYSHVKNPFGFDTRADYWTEEISSVTNYQQASPVSTTWYNLGSLSITIPIGLWRVEYFISSGAGAGANAATTYTTLSTSATTQSDVDFTSVLYLIPNVTQVVTLSKAKILNLTSKTTYYLNMMADNTSIANINFYSALGKLFVRAICGYL